MKDIIIYNNEDSFNMENQKFVFEFIAWTRFMFLPILQAFNWNEGMFLFARNEPGLYFGSLKGLYNELTLLESYGIPRSFELLFTGLKEIVKGTIDKKEDLMID